MAPSSIAHTTSVLYKEGDHSLAQAIYHSPPPVGRVLVGTISNTIYMNDSE